MVVLSIEYAIGGFVGLAFGTLVAFLNANLTKRYLKKAQAAKQEHMASVLSLSFGRQLISIAALACVFLLRNWLPWPLISVLLGAAIGLTVLSFIFVYRITKRYQDD